MDALKLLKQGHDKVKKILSQLDDTTEKAVKTRTTLFETVKRELTIHETIEEEILYPAFQEQAKLKDIVLEGYQEHHVVDLVMGELTGVSPEEEQWGAKLSVMKETVEHHIEEEEGEMFKKARQLFDPTELEALGTRLEARKTELEKESPEDLQESRDAA
ncbi:MAG: hemerythrin domain-containing protein [Terriglobia bacterium]|jgi:iron-sulfur cluster repair protein YtfE (RIC family)|nr:hemerythrin domain-containing protein [Terriglobia bacterium]